MRLKLPAVRCQECARSCGSAGEDDNVLLRNRLNELTFYKNHHQIKGNQREINTGKLALNADISDQLVAI
jgi:hypothetical protein